MKAFFKKLWNGFELYIMVVLMTGFLLTVFWGIFCRVFFKAPVTWSEELSRFMFIWMVFLGLSYSTLHESHIRVTFVAKALFKGKSREVLEIAIYLVTLAVFGWIAVTGIEYVGYCSAVRTPAMQLPRAWFVTILPLTGFLMVIRTVYKLAACVRAFSGKDGKEGKR